jgi:transcriptional regulator with GAF, ATPase, and Fis domain
MVKLNCSAIPANLIESELFGHEKGSFTGAIERRVGKFELANRGTLFLDEIGEMPLDMQVKLLRAIQEREIERVGGKTSVKIDVRIIAATNRNLAQEVAEGKFRSDLYYRLNVFPIFLPPLRDRIDDIPSLVSYFIDKLSKKTGRNVSRISEKAMASLLQYTWPGNVRELEHLLERSMLVTKGTMIKDVPLQFNFASDKAFVDTDNFKTLEQAEREYIVQVLNKCGGKVYGPGGAAHVLGLKRSTLLSKIKKLGISREKTAFR